MLPFFVILLAFAADRVTKWWAADNLIEFRPLEVNSFLTLQPTYNRGIAFGMFQGVGPVVGWFSILIIAGLFIYLLRTPRRYWLLRMGLALIIGGALGNLIDRITAGEVLDFIRVSFLPGIFNVSDVMVNVGMGVSLAAVFLQPQEQEESAESSQPLYPSGPPAEMDEGHYEQEDEPGFTDSEDPEILISEKASDEASRSISG